MRVRKSFEGRAFFGVLLVGWGVFALLDNFGLIDLRSLLRSFWPLIIIAWGATHIFFAHGGGKWFGGVAVVVGSIFLGNTLLGWDINPANLWPVVLIAVGLRIMLRGWPPAPSRRARFEMRSGGWRDEGTVHAMAADEPDAAREPEPEPETDSSATIREFAFFGGVERRNTSQAFRGGDATAVLGGIEVDLRECRIADAEARVDVFACLGGISFRIPRDWTVQSEVSAILGGFHDMSSPPVDGASKRFVISGQAVMGGIEIKN